MQKINLILYAALVLLVSFLATGLLVGCSGAELAQTCETVEPFRPLIRAGLVAAEPALMVPFLFSSQVSCADVEAVLDREAPP
jgi:hypothetical protein